MGKYIYLNFLLTKGVEHMKNFKSSTIIKKMFLMLLFMFFVIFGIAKENILVTKAYNSQENSKIHVNYSLHMQSIGWQEFKNDGELQEFLIAHLGQKE